MKKHGELVRRDLFGEVEGHEDFVGIEAIVLEGVFFEPVLEEAERVVEAEGGLVRADYGELELFYFWAGVVDYDLDELAAGAGAARGGADVHRAEQAFVGVFQAGELGKAGCANELGVLEGAEDGGVG